MKVRKPIIISFLLPALVLLLLFKIYPILYSVNGSLYEVMGARPKEYVGLENYARLFDDPEFWNSALVTLKFVIITVPLQIFLAIGLAVLMNKKVRFIKAFRTIAFLPIAMAVPVSAIIWELMYNPGSGLFNSFLRTVGGEIQPFLGSADQALFCIIVMCTWAGVSYWSMFLLAGMQQISPSLYEAARIDGASQRKQFFKITLPLMRRSIAFVLIANTVANSLLFAPMYLMTEGGPSGSTNVLMLEAYQSMFVSSDLGRSYAIITIMIILLLGIVTLQSKFMKSKT